MERTDEELIQAYQAGEAAAYEALFHRHKGKVFNFALRILGNRADAEDVTSEVFIQLFHRRYQNTGKARLSTWLLTVARNASLTRLRSRQWLQPLWFKRNATDEFEEWDIPDIAHSPSDALKTKEMTKAVKKAILLLPEGQKEAVILREYLKKDYAEISQILDCSVDNVKILIFRGRERLRVQLAAFIKEEII